MNTKRRCTLCREYFLISEMYRNGTSGVCSEECMLALVERARNKRARRKLHKEKRVRYGRRLPGGVRERVRTRDRVCRWCGSSDVLSIHHVLYRSQGGPDWDENLILLCFSHHEMAHSDKKRYQSVLLHCLMLGQQGTYLTVPEALAVVTDEDRLVAMEWGKEMLRGQHPQVRRGDELASGSVGGSTAA